MSSCNDVNYLNESQFIAGGEQYYEYQLQNSETGALLDISDLRLVLTMNSLTSPSDFNSVQVEAEYKDQNTFRVTLTSEMTKDLRGVYLQQPVIIDYLGKEIKPAQGRVIIIQSVNNN